MTVPYHSMDICPHRSSMAPHNMSKQVVSSMQLLLRASLTSDKEVSFTKGDIIDLTKEIDANWLEGTVEQYYGVTGIFQFHMLRYGRYKRLKLICTK